MITARHFTEGEFQKCSPSCSLQDMEQETIDKLDAARDKAGIPFVLNSAYRSVEHEKKQGRAGTSSHTLGRAVDIRCNTSTNRMKIVRACLEAGFTRIGIGKNYVHVDDSPTHSQDVMWHYY